MRKVRKSYINFTNGWFVCTKAIAGSRRGRGGVRCVNMTYSIASRTPTSQSGSPITLPLRHSGEPKGTFPSQTARRLSRWIVFCQITSLSWPAISLREEWLGRQEVQLTAFGSHLGNKYLSLATPLTSLILAPSVSQWLSAGTERSRSRARGALRSRGKRCVFFPSSRLNARARLFPSSQCVAQWRNDMWDRERVGSFRQNAETQATPLWMSPPWGSEHARRQPWHLHMITYSRHWISAWAETYVRAVALKARELEKEIPSS